MKKFYEEIQKKWQEASLSKNCNSLISPAGLVSKEHYKVSGHDAAKKILEAVPGFEKKTFIDFGCGNGRVCLELADDVKKIFACDFAQGMLDQFDHSKIVKVIVKDNQFTTKEKADVAFSISVIYQNSFESGFAIIKNMAANVKKNGILLLQIPIYKKSKEPLHYLDVGIWSEEMLHDAAKQAGCKVIEVKSNEGEFSFSNIGKNHGAFQVLKKI